MTGTRVKLRVLPVSWLADYHGREVGLVGQVVDAVALTTPGTVAYVDDRDGVASELLESALMAARAAPGSVMARKTRAELMDHSRRRFLHGDVIGVIT